MNYYTLPRLIFFKKDGSSVDFEKFKQELLQFVEKEFDLYDKSIQYGSSTYNAPERDNQFIEGYTRAVYFQYTGKNHHKFVIHFYDEESSTSAFEKTWMYNFYSLSFYFVQGDEWTWVKQCWEKIKAFMLTKEFYDATFSYTYGQGNLYDHFNMLHDEEAKRFIIEHSTKEEMERFQKQSSYIEIQHKPYLNIPSLLAAHRDKEKITCIQINHNGLEEWPDALFEYPLLDTLNIYNNKLTKADERFTRLKNLRTINMNENPLVKDSGELEKLKSFLPKDCSVVFY